MFINDIHILYYIVIGLVGLGIGRILDFINTNLAKHEKIFSLENIKLYIKQTNANYILMLIMSVLYIILLLTVGIEDKLKLIQFIILIPMLVSAFCIDYKLQIIPNRLSLTIFETGLIFSFIRGLSNLNIAIEMWLGLIVGATIFLCLTYVGNIIFKKETMGFGDVKIMGALGLFFGWKSIIAISIISFFVATIFSIILIIIKKIKKQDINEFIPFGPFIVISTFIVMFIPFETLIEITFIIFTLGKYKV